MASMRLGTVARAVSPLTYADPTAPVVERAFINLIEVLGGRSTLVKLYEHWRAQWPLSGMSLCQRHVAVVECALLARRLAADGR
jgi:hypothetical protein